MGKQKIEELIEEMSHYDPDNMEMAAKRVAEMVLAGEVDVADNPKMADAIREAFMKQIDSENDTVQSEAIKYLADIVAKLPGQQVEIIFDKILNYIIDLHLTDKKRERYGACAASVIHHAAPVEGPKLQNLFLKSIKKLLEYQDKKSDIEMILITIITEFLKKWPNVASRLTFDRKSLIVYLLRNVQVKEKLDIIKKTQYCLGKLTAVLDKEHVDLVLNEQGWGLVRFIQKCTVANSDAVLVKLRNGLLCLSQVIRTHNLELRHWIKGCAMLQCDIINRLKGWEELEKIEVVCDIIDTAVTGLANTLKIFSKELRDVLEANQNPLSAFVGDLLNFNAEGLMGYVGEPVEVQGEEWAGEDEDYGDYYEEQEADEKCWKVRRSVLYYIPYLAKHDRNFMARVGEGQFIEDLGNKMVEESSSVSQMAFFTFNELIELISVNRTLSDEQALEEMSLQRVKSNALEVAAHLITEITKRIKVIFSNAKFNDQLKIESSKILLRIIKIYNHILITNEGDTFGQIGFILDELAKTNIQDNKVNLLNALKELISADYPLANYLPIYKAVFAHINAKHHFKLHAICFDVLTRFNRVFRDQIDQSPIKNELIALLKDRIKQMDSDKTVKQAVAKCVGSVFEFVGITEDDWVVFLDSISNKYRLEIDKLYLIEVMMRVRDNLINSKKKHAVLEALIKQVSENLGSTNYEVNHKTIHAINRMLPLVWPSFSKTALADVLSRSEIILKDGNIPSFFQIIADKDPKALKPYATLIVKTIESYYIYRLIECGAMSVKECINILKGLDLKDKKKISEVLGRIIKSEGEIDKELDETAWGRILIGAMGYIGNEATLSKMFRLMGLIKSEEARYDVCSAIGNIASRSQDKLVPQLMADADKAKDLYNYIFIFKEMLCFNEKPFKGLVPLIKWLFNKCAQRFDIDSNYFITAECIGISAFMGHEALSTILEYSRSQNENQRFIVANSMRFGLEHRGKGDLLGYEDYVHNVVTLGADPIVKVREGSLRSVFSIAQYNPEALKRYSHDAAYWRSIINNCIVNDQLISIIDYGVCKEVRDEGKNLRQEAFTVLLSLTKHTLIDNQFIEELMNAAVQRIEEESSYDIVMRRLSVLYHLCKLDFHCFLRIQNDFITKMGLTAGVFKRYKTKVLDDRDEIFLRGILTEVLAIEEMAKEEGSDKMTILMTELRGCANLRNVMSDPSKNRE